MGVIRAAVILQLAVILMALIWPPFVSSFDIFSFLYGPVHASCVMGNLTSSPPGGLPSTACLQYVQDVVSQNCVVIFSKSTCPYCKMAKNIFNEIGATYKVIELDEHNDGRRLQEALAHMTGARTVPRVFVNGHCIGGGSDTRQLHQQGKLVPLIEQCAPCCAATSSEGSGDRQFESAK
ncbi:glutaredoxin 2 isoform X1 [Archocentrus centrarchus]|uniref:glutaredoxin 2 isoform X1 n=2 Tax=Archocentrus centrarchus TaxID=63155 RepID=UPI0011E9F0B0|nr:glutaredoxin 2 isoform X1 [Archocentrus centrarchus]XP_030582445.1 glutaredoxin 2 isoform X1 [Archocentrus centrarchus]XP_030582446.1 glutaredoxin 2 isoform X1 [Archocentrus centrarchus]